MLRRIGQAEQYMFLFLYTPSRTSLWFMGAAGRGNYRGRRNWICYYQNNFWGLMPAAAQLPLHTVAQFWREAIFQTVHWEGRRQRGDIYNIVREMKF